MRFGWRFLYLLHLCGHFKVGHGLLQYCFGLGFELAVGLALQRLFEVFHGFEIIMHVQLVVVHFLGQLFAALVVLHFLELMLFVYLGAMVAVLIRVYRKDAATNLTRDLASILRREQFWR